MGTWTAVKKISNIKGTVSGAEFNQVYQKSKLVYDIALIFKTLSWYPVGQLLNSKLS